MTDEDCLFIEYIYIIDENKKCVYCFEHIYNESEREYYYQLFLIIPENLYEIFLKHTVLFISHSYYKSEYENYRDVVIDIFGTVDFSNMTEENMKEKILVKVI